jgi:hypothetical protein
MLADQDGVACRCEGRARGREIIAINGVQLKSVSTSGG